MLKYQGRSNSLEMVNKGKLNLNSQEINTYMD